MKKLFAAFKSVDEKERLVVGVLAEEALDKTGEVMDYASSKKYFEKWNQYFAEKTEALGLEKSVGNLRVMHDTKKLGGKFVEMNYNDETKQIEVVGKVTDDDTWNEVLEGVYTGFSIGARYAKKWKDSDGNLRWTAAPFEGSLVDNPCMYGAQITAVKADGASAAFKFAGKNSSAEKGMWTAQSFMSVVVNLCDVCCSAEYEEEYENDDAGKALAAQIRESAKQLGELCKQYVSNEIDELNPDEVAEMADKKTATAEAGVRPNTKVADEPGIRPAASKSEGAAAAAAAPQPTTATKTVATKATKKQLTELVNTFATSLVTLLGGEGEGEEAAVVPAAEVEAGKVATKTVETAEKVTVGKTEFDALKTLVKDQGDALVKANETLEKFANVAVPSPVSKTRVVGKESDGGDDDATKGEEKKDVTPLAAIKGIHARGAARGV